MSAPTTTARWLIIRRLATLLEAHPTIAAGEVQVATKEPGGLALDANAIYLTNVQGQKISIPYSAAGRKTRDDHFTLSWDIWVAWREDDATTMDRASEIIAAMEDVCAGDPHLGFADDFFVQAEISNENGPMPWQTPNDAWVGVGQISVDIHVRLT